MNLNHLESCVDINTANSQIDRNLFSSVSLEAEIPERLFRSMQDFIGSNPGWDQYSVLSSALANFLFQNGCVDRSVTEIYLNDLFSRSDV